MNGNADNVRIVEVAPRDGLQYESTLLDMQQKIDFIDKLSATGVSCIETTSFVNPKRVPQMADAEQVYSGIHKRPGVVYSALVPNQHGMQRALQAGVEAIAVFSAASEQFCQKNINCSIQESLQRFAPVVALAKEQHIPVRAYLSCVFACPYAGRTDIARVVDIAQQLLAMGCDELSLGDTIGVGTPGQCRDLLSALLPAIPVERLAVHFHDTRGQALANILSCLEFGVRTIDSAVAGLGGCPFAPGAGGNVATEDVVYMLEGLGLQTGIHLDELIAVGNDVCRLLKRNNDSKVARAGLPDWKAQGVS